MYDKTASFQVAGVNADQTEQNSVELAPAVRPNTGISKIVSFARKALSLGQF